MDKWPRVCSKAYRVFKGQGLPCGCFGWAEWARDWMLRCLLKAKVELSSRRENLIPFQQLKTAVIGWAKLRVGWFACMPAYSANRLPALASWSWSNQTIKSRLRHKAAYLEKRPDWFFLSASLARSRVNERKCLLASCLTRGNRYYSYMLTSEI